MHLNLLSFELISETLPMNFYTEKVEEQHPLTIFKVECPILWEQNPEILADKDLLFCSFTNEEAECTGIKFSAEINLYEAKRFATHYVRHILYNYFLGKVAAVSYDFVDGVELWVKANKQNNERYTEYYKFSLNPQHGRITKGFELLVSFNGISRTFNTPISQLTDTDCDLFSLVISKGKLVKYKNMTTDDKADIEQIFPVLNFSLNRFYNLPENRYTNYNKYKSTQTYINGFCKSNLFNEEFKNTLNIAESFIAVPDNNISKVSGASKDLLFSKQLTSLKPFEGMRDYGPFQSSPSNNVSFFFLYQQSDLEHVKIYHDIFTNGLDKTYTDRETGKEKPYKAFKPLSIYIKQPYHTESNSSIFFTSLDTAVEEVKKALVNKVYKPNCTYVAIYISPLSKTDIASPHFGVYYQIKELLLDKGITSQVIYKERHSDEFFTYHLPNIEIALLAKIGGIPWRLASSAKNDLIVGVGAFHSLSIGKRYIGSAFSFTKEGLFNNFDCYRDNDLDHLVADIRKALMHYVIENEKAERLIIHYYKTMRKKDSQRIVDMLNRLGLKIPVVILTINKTESNDIFAYNSKAEDLMPMSGTIVRVGNKQYLLYNNAKYNEKFKDEKGKKDYHFPVKIKISSANEDYEITMPVVRELLDQVYQFSRMYWKSVSQQNLPITIKYPEMVAEIVPHFSDAELPQFGKSNLWFL